MAYFQNIFSTPNSLLTNVNAPSFQQTPADPEAMLYTNPVPTHQELHNIVKHMRTNASPGPDGLNAVFYKNAWPWISKDVHTLVTDFYTVDTSYPRYPVRKGEDLARLGFLPCN